MAAAAQHLLRKASLITPLIVIIIAMEIADDIG